MGATLTLLHTLTPNEICGPQPHKYAHGTAYRVALAPCTMPYPRPRPHCEPCAARTDADYKRTAVVAAASCALPDWPEKLVWLLSRGCTESNEAYWAAARMGEGAMERVQLLRELFLEHDRGRNLEAVLGRFREERERAERREGEGAGGLPAAGGSGAAAGGGAAAAAPPAAPPAAGGTDEAMRWLVEMGLFTRHDHAATAHALAAGGHVACLAALRKEGYGPSRARLAVTAAEHGQMGVLEWLAGLKGRQRQQQEDEAAQGGVGNRGSKLPASVATGELLCAGVRSGRVEVVAWLRGVGCPAADAAVVEAARVGSPELVEWMAARGWPMPVGGSGSASGRRSTVLLYVGQSCQRHELKTWQPCPLSANHVETHCLPVHCTLLPARRTHVICTSRPVSFFTLCMRVDKSAIVCVRQADGKLYAEAGNGDVATLRALRRVGCPGDPDPPP